MKRNLLLILNLIIILLFTNSPFVMAADYSADVVTEPVQSSLIENSKTDKKILKIKKQKKKSQEESQVFVSSDVVLDSDYMDYYPDRYEVEAIGNAKVTLKAQGLTLYADKIVFNHDLNNIKAYDNVKLINNSSVTDGDFINIDLNEESGLITKPITKNYSLRICAEEGYMYSDRIEEYKGVAKILKNYDLKFGATSFAGFVNPGQVDMSSTSEKTKSSNSGIYRIKAKTIFVDSRDEHNIMTMKNADIYMNKFKIGSVPSLKVVTDKEHQYVETNIPEFGSVAKLGMYAGPGIVLNTPGASTLKLVPMVNYGDSKFGIGGIARFKNATNMTDIGYGSSKNEFIVSGTQKFGDHATLDYSQNTYQNEWFLGFRRPRYSAQLQYQNNYYIDDLDVNFSQRFSAGYFVDENMQLGDGEGRMRWLTQTQKNLYTYNNPENDFSFKLGAVVQTGATLYTSGETVGIVRVGPTLNTKYKNWDQNLIYYQSATAGQSPFLFDKYAYGKSNLVLIESLKINKYVTVGYLASLAFLKDNSRENMFQENRFLLSLGPEYARVTFGYDAFRQTTMVLFSMLVGTEGSEVAFDKAVIKNPDSLGKKPKPRFNLGKIFPKLNQPK